MISSPSPKPIALSGLAAISDRFDAAILDQWGVLHDGAKAPEGAIEAVTAMAAAGKRLVVLSNSARLGSDSEGRLTALGYEPTLFAGVVTSGETLRDMLRDRADPFFAALGRSVFLIARDATLLDGMDYAVADSPETADFILLGSSTAPELSLANDHASHLERGAARGLPLICANPDRVGIAGSGFIEGPGKLAAYYESLGGAVRYIGKPHAEVYARARHFLDDMPAERILAVGDSLEHDIAGGIQAGCLTALVAAGIHAADLDKPDGLSILCAHYGATPDFVIPRLLL
jgi:HAD superfamily hydrolase (TIGR01459 family)